MDNSVLKKIIDLIKEKRNIDTYGHEYYYYKPKENVPEYLYGNGRIEAKKSTPTLVYTNWFKVLVNQKIDYSLSKEVTIEDELPEEFDIEDILDKMALEASLSSAGWLHLYINNESKLDWVIISNNNIIPIYDQFNKYIKSIIYFTVYVNEANEEVIDVQIWDNKTVTEFSIVNYRPVAINVVTKTHYLEKLIYKDVEEEINPKAFGFVPYIPMYNNKNHESDIEDIKALLDVYNSISTGFIENIHKFQEAIMVLKGYGGQEFDDFWDNLQKKKAIAVDENGDVGYMSIDIPVEARQVLLEIVKDNIFILGRGVDPTNNGDGNVTNVVIRSRYAGLDNKCSDMEKQIRIFYKQMVSMLGSFYGTKLLDGIECARAQIFNVSEMIEDSVASIPLMEAGIISKKTLMENDPRIDDVDIELEQIEVEKVNNDLNNKSPDEV